MQKKIENVCSVLTSIIPETPWAFYIQTVLTEYSGQ